MTLDALHAEYAGGGPGYVSVRVTGRARAAQACRLAPPALLVADGAAWRRLAVVPGTPLVTAGPSGPAFTVEIELPLHLAAGDAPWWLEPGPVVADEDLAAVVTGLRDRVRDLGADLAALRERATTAPPPAPVPAPTPAPAPESEPATATAGTTATAAAQPPEVSPTAVPVRRPRLRPTLPVVLVAAGSLILGDAVATVVWQEPISALWASRQQHELEGQVARLDRKLAAPTAATAKLPEDPAVRMRAIARTLETSVSSGQAIGRLRIPHLDSHYVVVQGTGSGSLRRGPGHYLGTSLPGQPGTVAIAGHRTTYGAPFRHLDALRRGDAIDVTMPYGDFVYRVEGTRIVSPDDVSALKPINRQRLVLTACHPLYSAAQRIVVIAALVRSTPRGAARVPAASAPRSGAAPAGAAIPGTGPRA